MSELQSFAMTINGEAVLSDEHAASVEPATGTPWAAVPVASATHVDQAVAAARTAFDGPWRALTATQRGTLLFKVADLIELSADELALLETRSSGKLLKESLAQVRALPRWYRYFGGWADKIDGRVPAFDLPSILNVTTLEPLGVVAAISAWNSPLMLSTWKLAPALAAGNTVVLKPSELASPAVLAFARLFAAAGFPNGTVNVISGDRRTGEALVTHSDVDFITFTGGAGTARAIAHAVADNLTPTAFELGGKSAQIVMADCDLDAAVSGVVAGVFAAAGQTCVAGSRLVIQREIAEAFLDELIERVRGIRVGDPRDEQTDVGPIISESALERVSAMVARAVADGAVLATGGTRVDGIGGGAYYAPTVLTNVHEEMEIAREEVFGPVLSVIVVDSEAEAVRIANSTSYSLAAGVWSRDVKRAHRIARALQAGTVWVNTYRSMSPLAPQGGSGLSGHGREGGLEALGEFTQSKSVWIELSEEARDPFAVRLS